MLLYTSVPPVFSRKDANGEEIGATYLAACVNSWRENGFDPISVNRPDEVDAIEALGLLPVRAVSMHGAVWPDRFGPPLGGMFDVFPKNERLAFVNSDIYMLRSNLASVLGGTAERTLFAARRSDVEQLGSTISETFRLGFDFFCFNPADVPHVLSDVNIRRFQLGAPWWDYVFPLACMISAELRMLREPAIAHQIHGDRWDKSIWGRLGIDAAQTMAKYYPSVFPPILGSAMKKPENAIAIAFQERLFDRAQLLDVPTGPCDHFAEVPAVRAITIAPTKEKKRSPLRRAVYRVRDVLRVVRKRTPPPSQ
jgi:hypothetical protein